MNTSKLLITSLLAAAAMSVPAWADITVTQDTTYTQGDSQPLGNISFNGDYTYTWKIAAWGTATVSGLSGTGRLSIERGGSGPYAQVLKLSGTNTDFTGTIAVKKYESNSTRNVFLALQGEDAAINATVDVSNYGGLLLSGASATASNVKIAGLTGNSTGVVYATTIDSTTGQINNTNSALTQNGSVARTLIFTGSDTYSYAGTVGSTTNQSSLNLTKSGTGTQTLSGTSYFGDVTVSGGELIFSGTSATSKGTASVAGMLTTSSSGVVKVLENGVLDLSGATVSLANAIQNSGQVTLSTGTLFEVSTFGQTVSLISGTGTISGVEWNALTSRNFTYNGVALGRSTVDVSTAGSVNIISYVEAKTLTWNGSASDTWSEAVVGTEPSSKPWKDESDADDAFYAGDSVVFSKDETTTVTVADSGVLANTVTISAGTVSFTGGTITAVGGVSVTGGTLSVGATNTALGTNTITLSGGTLAASATGTLANAVNVAAASIINTQGNTMTLSGTVSGTGTLTKQGTGTLKLTNASILNGTSAFGGKILVSAGTLQFGNETSGMTISVSGGIEVAGGATLYFSGGSGYHKVTSELILNAGSTIQVRDAGAVTSSNAQYTFAGTVTVNSSESGVAKITTDSNNWAKEIEISGNLVGAGTLNYYRGNKDSEFNSNGRLIISGADNSQFTGKILVGGGANIYSNGLDLKANLSNATVALQASTANNAKPVFMRVMRDAEVKRLEGNAGTSIGVGVANGAYTLTVGEGDFAGTIADNSYNTVAQGASSATDSRLLVTGGVLSLVKNTAGTLTLSGTTSVGDLSVTDGKLALSGTANIAGTTTVSGGTLDLSGGNITLASTIQNLGTVTVNSETTFNISIPALRSMKNADGSFSVISGGNISGWDTLSADDFTFNGAAFSEGSLGRYSGFKVGSDDGKITFTDTAANLVWSNAADNSTWDTETSRNWTNGSTTGDRFYSYDCVEFNTNATVTVDSSGVMADIVKISAGTVSFSGGTITALGGVSVTGGTLNLSTNVSATGTLSVDGTLTSSAAVSAAQLSGSGTIDLGSTGTLTLSNATKFDNWTGTVAFKDRTITHTAFSMANYGTTGSTIEFSGVDGVFAEYAGTVNANLHLVNSTTSNKNYGYKVTNGTSSGAVTFAGKITGSGDIVMAWKNNSSQGTSFKFTGNVSEFEGKYKNTQDVTNSELTFSNTTLSDGKTSISGTGDIEWGAGKIIYDYATNVSASNTIVSGVLTKRGAGSLTLTGTNTYTGGTTVEAGTLIAANANALGKLAAGKSLTVKDGAKLQISRSNVDLGTTGAGVVLEQGAKLVIDYANLTATAESTDTEKTFEIMTAAVFSIYGNTLSAGDVTSSMTGAWELLGGDSAWLDSATWTLAGNTLSLTMTIPEPSVFGLLAGLGALALAGTRRRRQKKA